MDKQHVAAEYEKISKVKQQNIQGLIRIISKIYKDKICKDIMDNTGYQKTTKDKQNS